MKKVIKNNKFIIIFFSVIFILGICIYKDYGITSDEELQRMHSLVNYYEYTKLFDRIFKTEASDTMQNVDLYAVVRDGIKHYPFNKYGTAIQMPLVAIEHLCRFHLPYSSIFYLRHLYNFLIFFISLIYLYKILQKYLIKRRDLSLLGPIMLLLSPRIFGDSFYNIKDLMFLSLSIINLYYSLKFLEDSSTKNIIKLSIITSFNINCRVVGGIIIFFTLLFKTLYIKDHQSICSLLFDLGKLFLCTMIFSIIITPASWGNPFKYLLDTIYHFYNYKDPVSGITQQCFYFGKWIYSTHLPWHYLPVWITITTPFIYIFLFVIGIFIFIYQLITKKISIHKPLLFLNSIFIFMVLFTMILTPTTYGGWRHFYFIYPIFIIDCVFIFHYLMRYKMKKILSFVLGVNLGIILIWMVIHHPYQMEYFSFPWSKFAYRNFETNYWKITNTDAIRYIMNKRENKQKIITIRSDYNTVASYLLDFDDTQYIKLVENKENADYIIDTSKFGETKSKKYKEIYSYQLNGIRLYTIYQRIK